MFVDLQTQWRVGASGPTGLDYSALQPIFDIHDIERDQRRDVFQSIRIMESAALDEIRS